MKAPKYLVRSFAGLPDWRAAVAAFASMFMLGLSHAGGKATAVERNPAAADLTGRWEIVRVLTRNDAWTPLAPRPDDPRELGQTIEIAKDRLTFSHISAECKLLPARGPLTQVPVSKLFSGRDEPGKIDSIVGDVLGRLNGRAREYGADIARERTVTLSKIQCGSDPKTKTMPWPDNQNWIAKPARVADTLWWSREPDSLIILERSGTIKARPDPPATSPCAGAKSLTEQTICRNPLLRMLHQYVGSSERFVRTIESKLTSQEKQAFAAMPATLDACGVDEACLRERLLQQVHYLIAVEDRYALLPR